MAKPRNPRTLPRRVFVQKASAAAIAAVPLLRMPPRFRTPTLSLQPFLARPTQISIVVNAQNGHLPASGQLQTRVSGETEWLTTGPSLNAEPGDFFWWSEQNLQPSTHYDYRIMLGSDDADQAPAALGSFTTQRADEDSSYTAALTTDPHTGTFPDGSSQIQVLDDVVRNVRRDRPEFVIALGDNVAWSGSRDAGQTNDGAVTRAYTMYRRHVGPLTMSTPHFGLIGNWEGENGKFSDTEMETVAAVRRRYTPNPNHETYAEGGSEREDYYAFTWGPVLYVMLDVLSYTEPSGEPASTRDTVRAVEDWTLGSDQFAWLERTLAGSNHPFKFVCIHHAVGGDAGNPRDTLYGRGGARAIDVGEQVQVHALMKEHGVQIFFYGHDHVFVDDVADGIHYALCGSSGAPWKFGRGITGYERFWTDSGHARLTVRPESARVEYINLAGQPLHEFTVKPNT